MPFIFQPDPKVVAMQRVLPWRFRRYFFRGLWLLVCAAWFVVEVFFTAYLGGAFIILGLAFAVTLFFLFLEHGLEQPQLRESLSSIVLQIRRGETVNLAPWCSPEVLRIAPLLAAPTVAHSIRSLFAHTYAGPILRRLNISLEEVGPALRNKMPGEPADYFSQALLNAALHAMKLGHERIRFSDMFIAFAGASLSLRQFLFERELTLQDLDAVAHWEDRQVHEREHAAAFWSRENLLAVKPFGRSWSFGYTPTLDQYAVDMTYRLNTVKSSLQLFGRIREIQGIERTLARTSSANALLVGEPGVGVEDAVAGFALQVMAGASLSSLNFRRVVAIDLAGAVAGLRTQSEGEGRLRQILSEATRAGGTILVFENFHTLLGAEVGGASLDMTAVLSPFLKGSGVQVVATTTYSGLHEVIEKREGIMNAFERIEVEAPSAMETLQILLDAIPKLEKQYRLFVPYPTLAAVVTYSDQMIQDVPFPQKAFDLLETSLIAASNERMKVVLPAAVAKLVSEKTSIPVGALTTSERKKLLNLEEEIHRRIVDQEEAVRAIANALRRARAGVGTGVTKRPIGTFLFLGPTGVGKTETAKALAEVYFGSEEHMQRLDMSEFQGIDAVDRLIGSPATKEEGRLTTAIRENPFTLLLLDEFEKAHPRALDLFLQAFDEGRMKDGWGRPVSFTNTLIIATSNAGAEFIREYLQGGKDSSGLDKVLREEILHQGLFRPELLNRFDGVIVFKPLGEAEVREITKRLLKQLSAHMEKDRGVKIVVNDTALELIIQRGFNQEFGARELRRVIQDSVGNIVAKKLLETEIQRGATLVIAREDLEMMPTS